MGRRTGSVDNPPTFNAKGQRLTKSGHTDKRHANPGRRQENNGQPYATYSVRMSGTDHAKPWHVMRKDMHSGKVDIFTRHTSSEAAELARQRAEADQPNRRPSAKLKHILRVK